MGIHRWLVTGLPFMTHWGRDKMAYILQIFQRHFLEWKSSNFQQKFRPKGKIDNNTAFVQKMAWRRIGEKPLSELVMV